MRTSVLVLAACLLATTSACNSDPSAAAGAIGTPKTRLDHKAPLDQKVDVTKIVAPDMIQKPTSTIVAPDMIQKPSNAIVAPDMIQKPLVGEDGTKALIGEDGTKALAK